ncbi:hypothetical protein [Pseudoduganella violaceinigra]|uniref:hypothetical protein n=1 Tax=Pseudoduganella violaceinigra TaxID=246602 RepID=UPI000422CA7E|nr:hypothetical protein [Pseudoduganella violaceinigra]
MSFKFPTVGGPNFAPPAFASFKDSLKSKSNDELVNMLGKESLSPAQREAIGQELASRIKSQQAEKSGGGGGDEEDDLRRLLKKLQDGTISPEEMKQLAGMLGVSVAKLEKAKGKGLEESGLDLQGG